MAGAACGKIFERCVRHCVVAVRRIPRRRSGRRSVPVSGYPIVLEGTTIAALVAGGGRVATRKVALLIEAGAKVHVVAPVFTPELEQLAVQHPDLRLTRAAV